MFDANPKAAHWKLVVAQIAAEQFSEGLLDGPLVATFIVHRVRPKSHYRTGANSHLLAKDAPLMPISKPDVLKLARGIEDALTGVLWTDDARICEEHLFKTWGESECVEVFVDECGSLEMKAVVDTAMGAIHSISSIPRLLPDAA